MVDFVEEIEDKITTNFKVTKIPRGILKKFKKFCKEETGDIYWVGIYQLLKIKEQHEQLLPILASLQRQIDELREAKATKTKIKTFGG